MGPGAFARRPAVPDTDGKLPDDVDAGGRVEVEVVVDVGPGTPAEDTAGLRVEETEEEAALPLSGYPSELNAPLPLPLPPTPIGSLVCLDLLRSMLCRLVVPASCWSCCWRDEEDVDA